MKALEINTTSRGKVITTTVLDEQTGRYGSYHIAHTSHSRTRASQRGINDKLIPYVLEFGEFFRKQGLRFYAVAMKHLPKHMDHHLREKLNNLVVVMSGDSNDIITCYKANNAVKHVQRKASYLV